MASYKNLRDRRKQRLRRKIRHLAKGRPRLSVFRSNANIHAQIIDDQSGHTMASASTLEKSFREEKKFGGNVAAAKIIGSLLADRACAAGVTKIVFDRGGYLYHGRVKALAEAARERGLDF